MERNSRYFTWRSSLDGAKDGSKTSVQDTLKNAIIQDQETAKSKVASTKWVDFDLLSSITSGAGLGELRKAQISAGGEIATGIYPAPEPPMKFIKREADRSVERAERLAGVTLVAVAARDAAVAADLAHWGVLRLTGADRLSFLNGLCTAKLVGAAPGDVRDACFVNKACPHSPRTSRPAAPQPVALQASQYPNAAPTPPAPCSSRSW